MAVGPMMFLLVASGEPSAAWVPPASTRVPVQRIQRCGYRLQDFRAGRDGDLEALGADLPRSALEEVGWFHSVGLEPSGFVCAYLEVPVRRIGRLL
jgi:hypothetical protein